MHKLSAFLGASLLVAATTSAQAQNPTIKNAVATSATQVFVQFSVPLVAGSGPHLDITRVRLLPDNVLPTAILQNPLNRGDFAVTFAAVPATATRVCFDQVQFQEAGAVQTSSTAVCADLSRDPASLKASWVAALEKVPKTSRDKTLFASGFVTAASDESAGGADISLNPSFNIPNLNAFLQIKKATADEGDARHFETGANYRFASTWRPDEIRAIASETDPKVLNQLIRDRQANILAGWIVDVAGKLEGDPTEFAVTNFVGEGSWQLRTMTKRLLGRRGFWRGYVLPVGLEVGQGLGTAAPATPPAAAGEAPTSPLDVNGIVRYKAGAGFTAYYDNPAPRTPLRRVEFDIASVLRYLFERESRFNTETKTVDTTEDGQHAYTQANLKVFFGETDAGMFGFKLSYNRGRLPPVYAHVNSFEFGFLIESKDNDAKPEE